MAEESKSPRKSKKKDPGAQKLEKDETKKEYYANLCCCMNWMNKRLSFRPFKLTSTIKVVRKNY